MAIASKVNFMISGGFLLAFISVTLAASSESTAAWALCCAGIAAASYLYAYYFCLAI